jgi:predicted nucleotidyltransferase
VNSLDAPLAALDDALRSLGARYMIIGGIAVIARGVGRQTDDLDATVWAEGVDLAVVLARLADRGIAPRVANAEEFARQSQVLLLRHDATRTPIDLSFAWLPWESEALDRAERTALGSVTVPLATVDDLLIYKAIAWRERDRADIQRLLTIHGHRVDRARVLATIAEFGELLDEPERATQVAALFDAAG